MKVVNQVPHSNPDFANAVIELCPKHSDIGNIDDAAKYLDVLNMESTKNMEMVSMDSTWRM